MDLRINSKTYKNIETYTVPKLRNILNTASDALSSYNLQSNKDPKRQKYLEAAVASIEELIDTKLNDLKESRKCLNT